MAKKKKPERRNASPTRPLADIDATKERLPASRVDLTPAERKLLKDPDWIDEDEADTILAMRDLETDRSKAIPFEQYLKDRGVRILDR